MVERFFGISLCFLAVLFFHILFQPEGQWAAFAGAFLTLVAARWKDVTSIKLWGASAEMKEALVEANATVKQLHALALTQAKLQLENLHSRGRFGSVSNTDKFAERALIYSLLTEAGVTDKEIEEVRKLEYPYMHFDYANHVVDREALRQLTPAQSKIWNDFFSHEKRKGFGFEPSPTELKKFLEEIEIDDPETWERLKDYEHFENTNKHRRKDNPKYWPD